MTAGLGLVNFISGCRKGSRSVSNPSAVGLSADGYRPFKCKNFFLPGWGFRLASPLLSLRLQLDQETVDYRKILSLTICVTASRMRGTALCL